MNVRNLYSVEDLRNCLQREWIGTFVPCSSSLSPCECHPSWRLRCSRGSVPIHPFCTIRDGRNWIHNIRIILDSSTHLLSVISFNGCILNSSVSPPLLVLVKYIPVSSWWEARPPAVTAKEIRRFVSRCLSWVPPSSWERIVVLSFSTQYPLTKSYAA